MSKQVTVEELLAFEPFLHLEWLAGHSGKINQIEAILEMEGTAVISTGECQENLRTTAVPESLAVADLQVFSLDDVISYLDNNPCIKGVILSDSVRPELEPRVIKYIEGRSIPLIYSPIEDTYGKVRDQLIFLTEVKKHDRLESFAQSTIYYELKKKGFPDSYDLLKRRIGNPILFFDNTFELRDLSQYPYQEYTGAGDDVTSRRVLQGEAVSSGIAPPGDDQSGGYVPLEMIERISNELRNKRFDKGIGSQSNIPILDVGVILPLYKDGFYHGSLAALSLNSELTPLDMIYLAALREIGLEVLVNRRNIEITEKKHIKDFIHDLLYNNFESREEIISRGKYWGFDLSQSHQLYVVEPDINESTSNNLDLLEKVQLFASEAVRLSKLPSIIGQIQEQIVIVVPELSFRNKTITKENAFSLASNLHRKLKTYLPGISFAIGIGRYYPSILDLSRSFQEAKVSLELGKLIYDKNHITHFEDLGAVRLLASIDFLQLDNFCKEYLSEVILYDQLNETNLLDTLLLFFKDNGDVNTIAHKMFVHPNSLRNRLKKIEELTHADLKNYDDMLNLFIACKIVNMKNNLK